MLSAGADINIRNKNGVLAPNRYKLDSKMSLNFQITKAVYCET
jgi:hypothetical protein